MRKRIVQIVFIALMVCPLVAEAQMSQRDAYSYPDFNPADDHALLLQVENHNYLKNDEYFGNYVEGYTLPGFNFQPSLMYYPSSRVRLKVGVHTSKYFGDTSFVKAIPVISAHAMLTDSLQVILGSLRGNVHHEMLEPIYDIEYLYTDPVENGVQFLYSNKWFKGDMWLNWEQFIRKGDTIPEILTFGLNTSFYLIHNNGMRISIPFQFMIHHRGGQISNFNMPMLSLSNGATGIRYEQFGTGLVKKLQLNAHFLWFSDLTKKWGKPFTKGWAFYPTAEIESSKIRLMAGYFHRNNYASPMGSPLFQSVSNYKPDHYSKERDILTGKFMYCLPLSKGTNFVITADTYYDMEVGQLEYAYGFSLHVNPRFFLARISEQQ